MTTDRELLELAAKAASLPECGWMGSAFMYVKDDTFTDWNPLTDDGDALRLAVKLGLLVHGTDSPSTVWCQVGECPDAFLEAAKPDPYAATRRAITRAAAEIGRNLK